MAYQLKDYAITVSQCNHRLCIMWLLAPMFRPFSVGSYGIGPEGLLPETMNRPMRRNSPTTMKRGTWWSKSWIRRIDGVSTSFIRTFVALRWRRNWFGFFRCPSGSDIKLRARKGETQYTIRSGYTGKIKCWVEKFMKTGGNHMKEDEEDARTFGGGMMYPASPSLPYKAWSPILILRIEYIIPWFLIESRVWGC